MEVNTQMSGLTAVDPVQQEVPVKVLKNAMDIQKQQADMLIRMMQESGLGQKIDLFA
ncbi:MAG: YjfB family protein [Spirochaetales bacterium]|nr:YjfB family protein [Spirochaetales bacterium]